MSIKEFFGKAAAGIYVSGLSVIALVVALIGYIMYGTEKNNLEAVIFVFTVIAYGDDSDTGKGIPPHVG